MNNLKELRKRHGEKIQDIADLFDSNVPNWSAYDRGLRPLSEKHIQKLCDHFGVTAGQLLGMEPLDPPLAKAPASKMATVIDQYSNPYTLPENWKADLAWQIEEEDGVPELKLKKGDVVLLQSSISTEDEWIALPEVCWVVTSNRTIRKYIRLPGIELLYPKSDGVPEIFAKNGEKEDPSDTILGVIKSVITKFDM